jgi:hypothetical protein
MDILLLWKFELCKLSTEFLLTDALVQGQIKGRVSRAAARDAKL